MPRAVPVPFGDLTLQLKKVAKLSCVVAQVTGVDDDSKYNTITELDLILRKAHSRRTQAEPGRTV